LGEQSVDVTGSIATKKTIQAIMSIGGVGIGIIDAKWKGKTMIGVARHFSDGSTTYFTPKKEK